MLIKNYSIQINGYNFLEPRFYLSRKNRNKTQRDIDDWNGIGYKIPFLAVFMVLSLVSLAGLPPTSGFVGKVYLFRGLF